MNPHLLMCRQSTASCRTDSLHCVALHSSRAEAIQWAPCHARGSLSTCSSLGGCYLSTSALSCFAVGRLICPLASFPPLTAYTVLLFSMLGRSPDICPPSVRLLVMGNASWNYRSIVCYPKKCCLVHRRNDEHLTTKAVCSVWGIPCLHSN